MEINTRLALSVICIYVYVGVVIHLDAPAYAQTTSTHQPSAYTDNASSSSNSRGVRLGAGAEFLGAIIYSANTSPPRLSVDLDFGAFQVVPTFGLFFNDNINGGGGNVTNISFGGRFWYLLARHPRADIGVGGGLGLAGVIFSADINNQPSQSQFNINLDGGIRTRAFITRSFALDFMAGVGFSAGDAATQVQFGPMLFGSGGLHYYF